ncbi:MAG: CHASE domain-containing sensor histidine kinase [Bdellovibrionota bacterium]
MTKMQKQPSRQVFQGPFGLVVSHSVLIVLLLGVLASAIASLIALSIIQRDEAQRFAMARQEVEGLVKVRLEGFLDMLQHSRAFLTTKERVSRQDFRLFFQSVDINRAYPDLHGVGFADRIATGHRAAHERDVREDGYPRYRVWPHSDDGSYLYPVKYLEPFDTHNKRALGFDMHTEPRRAQAMDRARDTGLPSLTGVVHLLLDNEPGFILYLPVFKRGIRTSGPQERRWALQGFVFAPFPASNFFGGLFRSAPLFRTGIGMNAYAGTRKEGTLLFSSSAQEDGGHPSGSLHFESHLPLYGQTWTLETFVTKGFASPADRYAPLFVFLSGLLITFLASCVTYVTGRQAESQCERALSEQSAREQLQEAAREREGNLRIQEKLFHIAQVVSAELDLEKVVQAVTDAATSLSGAQLGAFYYGDNGETPSLYALSGISREQFDNLLTFRSPAIFQRTLMGGRAVRRDDITLDPLFEHDAPGGPQPVRSYLAVSVVSRSGEVLGGLFLAHANPGVFGDAQEKVVVGLAAQASIAIDNARLFQKSREAIETRDEFLSICSHELRTPLTSMKLQNQLAERTLGSGLWDGNISRFEKMVQQSGRQIDRLVRLIEEMLDISRIRSGKLSITPEKLDLTQLVEDTVERFAPQLQEAACRVYVNAPDTLEGTWDRLRLEQIVVNLLSNATKYGRGKPIHVDLYREPGQAVLSVKDEGMGIAFEHQARIFERFERAVPKTEISGLGLGLYIVKQILELQGGRIRVESEAGKGSRFVVELPLEARVEAPPARPVHQVAASAELT